MCLKQHTAEMIGWQPSELETTLLKLHASTRMSFIWHHDDALMFSLICAWINGWVKNGEAGDLRRHHAHYDVTVMLWRLCDPKPIKIIACLSFCYQAFCLRPIFSLSHLPFALSLFNLMFVFNSVCDGLLWGNIKYIGIYCRISQPR